MCGPAGNAQGPADAPGVPAGEAAAGRVVAAAGWFAGGCARLRLGLCRGGDALELHAGEVHVTVLAAVFQQAVVAADELTQCALRARGGP